MADRPKSETLPWSSWRDWFTPIWVTAALSACVPWSVKLVISHETESFGVANAFVIMALPVLLFEYCDLTHIIHQARMDFLASTLFQPLLYESLRRDSQMGTNTLLTAPNTSDDSLAFLLSALFAYGLPIVFKFFGKPKRYRRDAWALTLAVTLALQWVGVWRNRAFDASVVGLGLFNLNLYRVLMGLLAAAVVLLYLALSLLLSKDATIGEAHLYALPELVLSWAMTGWWVSFVQFAYHLDQDRDAAALWTSLGTGGLSALYTISVVVGTVRWWAQFRYVLPEKRFHLTPQC